VSLAWRRAGPYGPVKPRLLIRVVHRHERPETVRADVASDDQEIARRNVGQEPVLIAERNDSHAVISTPVSHRLVTAAIGPDTSPPCVGMTCYTSMTLTAVARLTDARLPGAMGGLPGLVPGAASTSRSLHR
jgi:hypothetical protein